jgi:hypothetical protein
VSSLTPVAAGSGGRRAEGIVDLEPRSLSEAIAHAATWPARSFYGPHSAVHVPRLRRTRRVTRRRNASARRRSGSHRRGIRSRLLPCHERFMCLLRGQVVSVHDRPARHGMQTGRMNPPYRREHVVGRDGRRLRRCSIADYQVPNSGSAIATVRSRRIGTTCWEPAQHDYQPSNPRRPTGFHQPSPSRNYPQLMVVNATTPYTGSTPPRFLRVLRLDSDSSTEGGQDPRARRRSRRIRPTCTRSYSLHRRSSHPPIQT